MIDKLPPHSREAEESVIGAILIDASVYPSVRSIISPEDFYFEKCKWLFEAMENIAPAIDELTVAHELGRSARIHEIGGPVYLSQIVSQTPSSVYAEHYAHIIAETSYMRKIISTAGQIAALGYSGEGGAEEISSKSHHLLSQLDPPGKHTIISPEEHAKAMYDMLNERLDGVSGCIPYGYLDLDDKLGGLYPGDLVIVGARPSVGKSQLLLEIAHTNAKIYNPVLFAAIEMSLKQMTEREVSMGAKVGIPELRRLNLTPDEWDKAVKVNVAVGDIPLYFLCGKCSVATIKQRALILKQTVGLKLIIVDYLQLLKDKNDRSVGKDLRERVGYISGELKNMAMELDVNVMVASQFSRDVEYRADHRPRLSDLRESGDLEQDADVVLLLHRPELFSGSKPEDKGILDIGIAKVRQGGQTGQVQIVWKADEYRYRDLVR